MPVRGDQSRDKEDVLEWDPLNLIEVRGHSAHDVRGDGGFDGTVSVRQSLRAQRSNEGYEWLKLKVKGVTECLDV